MASSGFHSNGYSLVRRVVTAAGLDLTATPAGLDRPLGEELLEPTRIYARDCLALVDDARRRAGARLRAHHRRRAGRQHGAGRPRRARGGARPRHLGAARGRAADGGARGAARRSPSGRSTAASAWSPRSPPDAADARAWRSCAARGVPAWVAGTHRRARRRRRPGRPPGRLLPLSRRTRGDREAARRHRSARRHCGVGRSGRARSTRAGGPVVVRVVVRPAVGVLVVLVVVLRPARARCTTTVHR